MQSITLHSSILLSCYYFVNPFFHIFSLIFCHFCPPPEMQTRNFAFLIHRSPNKAIKNLFNMLSKIWNFFLHIRCFTDTYSGHHRLEYISQEFCISILAQIRKYVIIVSRNYGSCLQKGESTWRAGTCRSTMHQYFFYYWSSSAFSARRWYPCAVTGLSLCCSSTTSCQRPSRSSRRGWFAI